VPEVENGNMAKGADAANKVSGELGQCIDKGYEVVALTPSCALMLKVEWPLILPADETVQKLAEHTYDITEYVVDIAKKEGLADGLGSLEGGVALHMACHARAQNDGAKAGEMHHLLPEADGKDSKRR